MSIRDYVLAAQLSEGPETSAAIRESEALAVYKASPLRRGADEAKLDAHLDRKTRACKDAPPVPGQHPLILYAPSINSDPYESAVLSEFLASHGYVIASAPSIGLHELEVSRDEEGARAQVGDLQFVLSQVWSEPFVDSARLGVLGYSWGGMTALLFTLPHWEVDAVACLDGAMRMAEYLPVAESFASWSAQNLRAALLDIAPSDEKREPSLGEAAAYADTYAWLIPGVLHRDFAWDFIVRYRYATGDPACDRVTAAYGSIARRLKEFFDAYLKDDRASLESLRSAGAAVEDSTWSFRIALPEPPTAAQFDQVIEEEGVAAAVELFHALRRADPDLVLFDEKRLLRYPVFWGPERAADLVVLLNMNLEAYPASAETHFWLAQVHLSLDETGTALQELKTALALDPGHEKARQLVSRLDPESNPAGKR
jgi:dienelactone hydrolase